MLRKEGHMALLVAEPDLQLEDGIESPKRPVAPIPVISEASRQSNRPTSEPMDAVTTDWINWWERDTRVLLAGHGLAMARFFFVEPDDYKPGHVFPWQTLPDWGISQRAEVRQTLFRTRYWVDPLNIADTWAT
jgi:hypothetical protein